MDDEYPDSDLMLSPRDPMTQEQYERILELISHGWTVLSIAEDTGVSKRKVKAIRARNPGLASAHREELLNNIDEFTLRAVQKLNKDLPNMHPDRLALSAAILIDKGQLLRGQATQRIDTKPGFSQEHLIEVLENMKRAKTTEIEAETSPVESPAQLPEPKPEILDARFADPSTLIHQRNLREYEQHQASVRHWTGEP
jgi:hypothetical protein